MLSNSACVTTKKYIELHHIWVILVRLLINKSEQYHSENIDEGLSHRNNELFVLIFCKHDDEISFVYHPDPPTCEKSLHKMLKMIVPLFSLSATSLVLYFFSSSFHFLFICSINCFLLSFHFSAFSQKFPRSIFYLVKKPFFFYILNVKKNKNVILDDRLLRH